MTETPSQQDLFDATIAQQFDVWRQTPGGKFILNMAYKQAAAQAARFLHCGQRGSIRLVWETLRYRLTWIRVCAHRKGVSLEKWGGYALNDHFHAHVARHIMAHRPEWDGLFERRTLGAKRLVARRRVEITEFEPVPA